MRSCMAILSCVALLAACSSGTESGGDALPSPEDTIAPADLAPSDLAPSDQLEPPDVPDDQEAVSPADVASVDIGPADEYGFFIRTPQERDLLCSQFPERIPELPFTTPDADWLCTFEWGETTGHIYVQATPVKCFVLMTPEPVYEAEAWLSVDGTASSLDSPNYDYGGNHHNDFFEFDWQGEHFKYYHSTFGFGWRACQPMDCMTVSEPGGAEIEDGCTTDRTLPLTCVPIKADGTHDELVDDFEKCSGDPEG
jgi:hypothetical protein